MHRSPTPHLIVLLGPTGVGKTGMSLRIAKALKAPILSADSRQFFREMRIGTAAPLQEQLNEAEHFFVGHKSIKERYSCGMFEMDALELLGKHFASNPLALLVGGSMLYIDAVCHGIDDFPTPDEELRESLLEQLNDEGIESLRAQLKLLDPEHYSRIDLKNPQRVLKAIEVCLQTGQTYTSYLSNQKKRRPFSITYIGLNMPREELYSRINQRVDQMVEEGLADEARELYPYRNANALKTVGYRELFSHFDGNTSLPEAIELIKRNSRRYAKRQLTWWARNPEIKWFHPENYGDIIGYLNKIIT